MSAYALNLIRAHALIDYSTCLVWSGDLLSEHISVDQNASIVGTNREVAILLHGGCRYTKTSKSTSDISPYTKIELVCGAHEVNVVTVVIQDTDENTLAN